MGVLKRQRVIPEVRRGRYQRRGEGGTRGEEREVPESRGEGGTRGEEREVPEKRNISEEREVLRRRRYQRSEEKVVPEERRGEKGTRGERGTREEERKAPGEREGSTRGKVGTREVGGAKRGRYQRRREGGTRREGGISGEWHQRRGERWRYQRRGEEMEVSEKRRGGGGTTGEERKAPVEREREVPEERAVPEVMGGRGTRGRHQSRGDGGTNKHVNESASDVAVPKDTSFHSSPRGHTLKLIKDVITRWNSTYYMLACCELLEVPLQKLVEELGLEGPAEDDCVNCCHFMKPF